MSVSLRAGPLVGRRGSDDGGEPTEEGGTGACGGRGVGGATIFIPTAMASSPTPGTPRFVIDLRQEADEKVPWLWVIGVLKTAQHYLVALPFLGLHTNRRCLPLLLVRG